MTDDEWLPVPAGPKPDEPITYEAWAEREGRKQRMDEATIAHIELVFMRERERQMQEIIDIVTGREPIDDGKCAEE